MPSVAILYHRGCRDGYAAAAVADYYYKEIRNKVIDCDSRPDRDQNITNVLFFGLDPGRLVSDLKKVLELDSDTIIKSFDVSFSKEAYELLHNRFHNLIIIDHHKTTIDNFPDGLPDQIKCDINYCGCVLAYKYFTLANSDYFIPLFLLYLQDRDLWKETQKDSNIINEGLFSMVTFEYENNDYNKPIFTKWHPYIDPASIYPTKESNPFAQKWLEEAYNIGKYMLEMTNRSVSYLKRNASKVTIRMPDNTEYDVMLINSTGHISELGNVLAKENDVFCTMVYRIVGTAVYFSLRSIDDNDTTEISRVYSGGGHRNSSGFECKLSQFKLTGGSSMILEIEK
jgi:oligoribonuclease NrnB/cAMP/cGMP phosphodiesterase (DHH superfamily)